MSRFLFKIYLPLFKVQFETRKLYLRHYEAVHKQDKDIECPQCNKFFKRTCDWQRHKRQQHGDNPETFQCLYCDFTSKWSRSYFLRHNFDLIFFCLFSDAGSSSDICPMIWFGLWQWFAFFVILSKIQKQSQSATKLYASG